MTPTRDADPVGPQHKDVPNEADWWTELEVHEIQQTDLDGIAEMTLDYDPFD